MAKERAPRRVMQVAFSTKLHGAIHMSDTHLCAVAFRVGETRSQWCWFFVKCKH
jgi:hypothetical protein